MMALGINKQMDLQTPLRNFGSAVLAAGGWQWYRQTAQAWAVMAIATLGVTVLGLAVVSLRQCWRQYRLFLFGVMVLAAFVVIRTAALEHLGAPLGGSDVPGCLPLAMEMTGATCVGLSAVLKRRGLDGLRRCTVL